jgi:Arc/MetJ family transcription regulator
MRTNIVIDDYLIRQAMQLTGITTKREVVDTALRILVRLEKQKAVLALEGQVPWEGDLESSRQSRIFAEKGIGYDADNG